MARVTVEDCLDNIENRFKLVMVCSKRARDIAIRGKEAKVNEENDKPTVLALREAAEGLLTEDILKEPEKSTVPGTAMSAGSPMGGSSIMGGNDNF